MSPKMGSKTTLATTLTTTSATTLTTRSNDDGESDEGAYFFSLIIADQFNANN